MEIVMNRTLASQTFFSVLLILLFLQRAGADMSAKATYIPSKVAESEELIMSAPPRGTAAKEKEIYEPIAQLISKTIGKKVTFRYSDNWLTYSKDMTHGAYDLVAFDGPHFNGWRQDKLGHVPLIKIKDDLIFVVITKAENQGITEVKDLAGRPICAHAPPNFGTLTLYSQFDNPARQPIIVQVQGWDNAYKGLIDGKCEATLVPLKNLAKFDAGEKKLTKIIYKSRIMPNQALSAGPRITPEMQTKIRQAMVSEEGKKATEKLRDAYATKELVSTSREEYAGLGKMLKDTMYFDK
jgi:ABC-type phosphate/phosphonate transport system substrate-binding protein